MSSPDRFADTNVLLYAVSTDEAEEQKFERALDLIDDGGLAFSTQVFGEFYHQATRAGGSFGMTHREAVEFIDSLSDSPVQALTLDVVRAAFDLRDRFQISYWDAAILAAAKALGCSEVLSEDLNGGQEYDGVTVRNPFTEIS
ncbi:MAG: PIN domain-containing protein [Nocardioides sp.]|nr:PIN domain-containing protein [Nocardioides sp.]